MYLPPLQPLQDSQICVSGDVTIHPSAAIAPGVLLQAEEGSRIVIGPGSCIGMGTVLQARGGVIELNEGVSLGAGVLLVGIVHIRANVCVGASSTIINCAVEAHTIIPPGSLLGDRSRQVQLISGAASPQPTVVNQTVIAAAETVTVHQTPSPAPTKAATIPSPWDEDPQSGLNSEGTAAPEGASPAVEPRKNSEVYGQAHVNELLSTLLPHRRGSLGTS